MVNVVVSRKRTINVSANGTGGVIDTSVPVTIKTTPTIHSGNAEAIIDTVDELKDVDLAYRANGSTLVYDANTHKYNVKNLEFTEIDGNLDGGTF